MSNIYLNSSYWEKLTLSELRFSKLKKFVSRSVFSEFQPTQISLGFKISCCNLKIRVLGTKGVCDFNIILVLKGCLKIKKVNFNKNNTDRKWKIAKPISKRRTFCFSLYKNRVLEINLWRVGDREIKLFISRKVNFVLRTFL